MAILFFDNFDGYAAANSSYMWSASAGNAPFTFNASGGRFNGPYAAAAGTNSFNYMRSDTFAGTTTLIVGFAFYYGSIQGSQELVRFRESGTTHVNLTFNADATLSLTRNGAALTGGTTVSSLAQDTWYYIEAKVTIANSIGANTCQINVNGVQWVNVTTGQDTQNGLTGSLTNILFGKISDANASWILRFADVYIDNGTTFLGDCLVETLRADGNGATQNFTASGGGSHLLDVDESIADGDSTYVESATINDEELFTLSNLSSSPSVIHAVMTGNLVRKTDAGTRQFCPLIRRSGTTYEGTTVGAYDSYRYDKQIFTTDPSTASAWTEAGVNAMEVGVKVKN